ncbi:MAG: hypothetical protein Q9220_004659 [cf. Caloplaca sp. 1 TL-2023]
MAAGDARSLEKLAFDDHTSLQQALAPATPNGIEAFLASVATMSKYFVDEMVQPYEFHKMGTRLQVLGTWLEARQTLQSQMSDPQLDSLDANIERTLFTNFPFIRTPDLPKNAYPFLRLRQSFQKGTKGIVIVATKTSFRPLCHLIKNIRVALNSSLPIQIAHAGPKTFSPSMNRFLTRLAPNITTLDITQTLSSSPSLNLEKDPFSIPPFAALASSFEQLILLDASSILLQPPEKILNTHPAYLSTGALFFHGHPPQHRDHSTNNNKEQAHHRHTTFFHHLLPNSHPPSPSLQLSRALAKNAGYVATDIEQDARLLVLDKSRTEVLMGLMHTCWGNSKRVRRFWRAEVDDDDRAARGDETWWLGFELAGSAYSWGDGHGSATGAVIGWGEEWRSRDVDLTDEEEMLSGAGNRRRRVCSNVDTTLGLNDSGEPLWFSGGLQQRLGKGEGEGKGYGVPSHWIVGGGGMWVVEGEGLGDGEEENGRRGCLVGEEAKPVTGEVRRVLEISVSEAGEVDEKSRMVRVV